MKSCDESIIAHGAEHSTFCVSKNCAYAYVYTNKCIIYAIAQITDKLIYSNKIIW